jgi:hypothetical protein
MPNLVEHVENRIGKYQMRFTIPRGYSSSFMQIRMFLDSDYIEKYIPKRNLLFVMQEP